MVPIRGRVCLGQTPVGALTSPEHLNQAPSSSVSTHSKAKLYCRQWLPATSDVDYRVQLGTCPG